MNIYSGTSDILWEPLASILSETNSARDVIGVAPKDFAEHVLSRYTSQTPRDNFYTYFYITRSFTGVTPGRLPIASAGVTIDKPVAKIHFYYVNSGLEEYDHYLHRLMFEVTTFIYDHDCDRVVYPVPRSPGMLEEEVASECKAVSLFKRKQYGCSWHNTQLEYFTLSDLSRLQLGY